MFAQPAATFMTLNRETPIPESSREHLLSHCPTTGFVLSVALPNRCLWKRDASTKSRVFDSIWLKTHRRKISPKNANQRIYRKAYGHKNLYNAGFDFIQIPNGIT
jgi:hypothetical protein